jgi:hypothetical protein
MSNTTTLSSYAHQVQSATDTLNQMSADCAEAITAGRAKLKALVSWLQEELQADNSANENLKRKLRRERLSSIKRSLPLKPERTVKSVELHVRDSVHLVRAAEKLGYRTKSLPKLGTSEPILLQNKAGERIALTRNARGSLTLHTAGVHDQIHCLVRQHTLDRTFDFLKRENMKVKAENLSDGQVQILARKQQNGSRHGDAELKVQVRNDGTAWVDVDKVKGNRCEKIVADFAQSIEAQATDSRKKEAYYQLPGEPTKTRARI